MKKIITLLVLMLVVLGAKAYDKNINLYTATTNNATWESSTGVLSFTSDDGYAEFAVSGVDAYTSVEVLVTAQSCSFRIALYGDNGWYAFGATKKETSGTAFGKEGMKSFGTNVVESIGSINKIRISLAVGESGSVTIPSICFKGLDVNSNTEGFGGLAFEGTQSNLLTGLKALPHVINQSSFNFLLGSNTSKNNTTHYLDVTDYDAIYFEVTNYISSDVQLRAYIGTSNASDVRYAHKITDEVSDWTAENAISENGWYYISLSDVSALRAISTQSLGSAKERYTVNKMYLVKSTFTMTDGKDASDIVYDPIKATVAYDRTFTVGRKSTVCLPFALNSTEVSDAGTFYKLTSAADGTLTFSEVSETEAYKPYVFEANTANPFASLTNKVIVASEGQACQTTVDGYTFQGTLAHQSLPSDVYGYNAENGVFSVTTTDDAVTIDAFRGYIKKSSGGPAREIRCVFGDEITGINEVKSQKTEENDILYNPSGQRVSADYKGIVIKNGRKYFKE